MAHYIKHSKEVNRRLAHRVAVAERQLAAANDLNE
jgi:hypothetical protein